MTTIQLIVSEKSGTVVEIESSFFQKVFKSVIFLASKFSCFSNSEIFYCLKSYRKSTY